MQMWDKSCLPYEVCTMAAERRLLEKPRSKLVVFHFMHIFLPQSTFAGESVPNPSRVIIVQKMVSHNGKTKKLHGHNLVLSRQISARFSSLRSSGQVLAESSSSRPHASPLPRPLLSASFSFKVTLARSAFGYCGNISFQRRREESVFFRAPKHTTHPLMPSMCR